MTAITLPRNVSHPAVRVRDPFPSFRFEPPAPVPHDVAGFGK